MEITKPAPAAAAQCYEDGMSFPRTSSCSPKSCRRLPIIRPKNEKGTGSAPGAGTKNLANKNIGPENKKEHARLSMLFLIDL